MKIMKGKIKCALGILAVLLLCGGCGNRNDAEKNVSVVEEPVIQEKSTQAPVAQKSDTQMESTQPAGQDTFQGAQSGEDLDVVAPSAEDDTWYMSGTVYIDEKGRRLEVFFDDEGMLQFAVDGLSMYFTTADHFQQENDWKIYSCDDGTTIIYYPGAPAHLEISDGEYAGLYEADEGK